MDCLDLCFESYTAFQWLIFILSIVQIDSSFAWPKIRPLVQILRYANAMSEAAVKEPPALRLTGTECPMTVKEAAKFLGVSPQTVYLWVERKQIPHLRVMGRNIRFLRSDLEPFRASFRQEMENV